MNPHAAFLTISTISSHPLRDLPLQCLSWAKVNHWNFKWSCWPRTPALLGLGLGLGLLLNQAHSLAQTTAPAPLRPTSSIATTASGLSHLNASLTGTASSAANPLWAELTAEQRQIFMPLAASWNSINEQQKRKWLEISKNYHTLTPEGRAKLNSRMSEWATLNPQQRAQARLNFGKTKELSKQLTPEEKKAKWEAYQALSPEEKQKLAAKASPKSSGAAPAVKPVAPQKLAVLPIQGSKPAALPAPPKAAPTIAAPLPTLSTSAPIPIVSTSPASAPER